MWELLAKSEELDTFLGKKFPNLKRYGAYSVITDKRLLFTVGHARTGCEGAESMLPALDTLFELSAGGETLDKS